MGFFSRLFGGAGPSREDWGGISPVLATISLLRGRATVAAVRS